MSPATRPSTVQDLAEIRACAPERIAEALASRTRGSLPTDPSRRLLVIAADHPARGAIGAGGDPTAMADRGELLARCAEALSRPGVDGFLGTADMVEDLALMGALEGKLVIGSLNRGGLAGSAFEMDDRFTGYDARGIAEAGLDGGKALVRVDLTDTGSVQTLEAVAHAVDDLAERRLMAMVEPFMSRRDASGRVSNDLSPEAVIRSIAIASGLGRTSAYTWLKLPAVPEMERVMAATTLPSLILGGEVPEDPDASLAAWADALRRLPNVRGLVIGRSLLFPRRGDVAAAVDEAVELM